MGYRLTEPSDDTLIDREFDHLLWRLDRDGVLPVQERCEAIISSPASTPREVACAHALLGVAALSEEKYEDAVRHSSLAIDTPYHIKMKALSTLNLARLRLGEGDQALQSLEDLVTRHPEASDAWYALGICYENHHDLDEAWRAFEAAYERRPSWKLPLLAIIGLGYRTAAYGRVASVLEGALQQLPWELDIRCALATCYLHVGEMPQCFQQAKRYLAFSAYAHVSPLILEHFQVAFGVERRPQGGA